jgi:hypothetical protein
MKSNPAMRAAGSRDGGTIRRWSLPEAAGRTPACETPLFHTRASQQPPSASCRAAFLGHLSATGLQEALAHLESDFALRQPDRLLAHVVHGRLALGGNRNGRYA